MKSETKTRFKEPKQVTKKQNYEENTEFIPKFDDNGLIPAIAQDARTGQVLMVAYMNRQALDVTIQSGYATYFSRSRQKLWKKGEESGHRQKVQQILVDLKKNSGNDLVFIEEKVYDPEEAYKK